MHTIDTGGLENIKTFDQLLPWLRDNLNWPIDDLEIDHEPFDNLTFEYDAARDLGLKQEDIAHIREIRQLRPLVTNQPWGIFFINFEDKKIPVGVLKRLLGGLTLKKRHSANKAEQKGWNLHDLLFISAHGKSGERELSFLHFTEENGGKNKIILKELGWDQQDTKTKLDYVAHTLKSQLAWPDNEIDPVNWREKWAGAFTSQHGAAIKTAKDLTKRLAQLATVIRKSVNEVLEFENKSGPLTNIYDNFKQTLFHNLTHDDFADMYAQTICYGLLAARIMRRSGGLVADDAALIAPLTQPFLKDLMETFLAVGGRKSKIDFNELGIDEVVDALYHADMDAVLRDFGNRNPDEDPILHFYEYFLRDYDSIKREQRGVYYTPLPVVRFIVRSVDEILKNEFGLEDGLADTTTWGQMCEKNPNIKIPPGTSPDDPFVQILDPALGTGRFLVEVIDLIEDRMKKKLRLIGKCDAEILELWNEYVPNHLLPRLNGFEIMMAPYAIAHIKIAMKLAETGYLPKDHAGPRVRVYLTNSLEEPIGLGDQTTMNFITESLAEEVRGVDQIKAHTPITVVTGNPPYAVGSCNKNDWIDNLISDYKKGLNEKKLTLSDDYIKFLRYSEWCVEKTGYGIVAMITNNSFIDGINHRQMRKHLLHTFDKIYILDLHGNSRKKESAPDGSIDENVFEIMQGVSINLLAKNNKNKLRKLYDVFNCSLFGKKMFKYKELLKSKLHNVKWEKLLCTEPYFFFVPKIFDSAVIYNNYISLSELFENYNSGIETAKDNILIQFNRKDMIDIENILTKNKLEELFDIFNLDTEKIKQLKTDIERDDYVITEILYRPFDTRFTIYSERSQGILWRPRHNTSKHFIYGRNLGLIFKRGFDDSDSVPVFLSNKIIDRRSWSRPGSNGADYIAPLYLYLYKNGFQNNTGEIECVLNIKQESIKLFAEKLGFSSITNPSNTDRVVHPIDIFYYIYSTLHSPEYSLRYSDSIKIDYPRVPLPGSVALYEDIASLGRQLVALHLLNEQEATVLFQPDTRYIGRGEARVEKGYPKYSNGKVMINAQCHFEDIAPEIWNFYIGGYQICEKWLKDRAGKGGKNPAPGRILTEDDILHYRRITIAIRETIKLMQQIDEVINAHGGWPEAFARS